LSHSHVFEFLFCLSNVLERAKLGFILRQAKLTFMFLNGTNLIHINQIRLKNYTNASCPIKAIQ